jgi:hypothetical protein
MVRRAPNYIYLTYDRLRSWTIAQTTAPWTASPRKLMTIRTWIMTFSPLSNAARLVADAGKDWLDSNGGVFPPSTSGRHNALHYQ